MSICHLEHLKMCPKTFLFKHTLGKNCKDRKSVSHFFFRVETITATAIHLLIGMFKEHVERQHGLHLPRSQETFVALNKSSTLSCFSSHPVPLF